MNCREFTEFLHEYLFGNLPADERVQVLVDALAGRDVEAVYLTPAARRLLERRARAAG